MCVADWAHGNVPSFDTVGIVGGEGHYEPENNVPCDACLDIQRLCHSGTASGRPESRAQMAASRCELRDGRAHLGSYGSENSRQTIKFVGEETWQGKKVMAFTDGSVTSYVDAQRRTLARVRGGAPIESFEPYFVNADWPIFVGKWWLNRFRYTDHTRGRSFDDVRFDAKVEAYEDVTTPAGTFKTFKIAFSNPSTALPLWYSPDLGLFVKSRAERFGRHYLGPGVRESELVSYDMKK